MSFRITIRFLDHRYHGQLAPGIPEWPPSPFRLFQAMLAGKPSSVGTLQWLEQLRPPTIVAPAITGQSSLLLPGILNDSDKGHRLCDKTTKQRIAPAIIGSPEQYRTVVGKLSQPRPCVSQALASPHVHYIWDEDVADDRTLASVVSNIIAVGWARDKVLATFHTDTSTEDGLVRWRPEQYGDGLRVPIVGTTDSLVQQFNKTSDTVLERPKYRMQAYCAGSPQQEDAVFSLQSENGRQVAFEPRKACEIAAWMRHIACESAKRDKHYQWPGGSERYVAGHANGETKTFPRLAYIPLPTIGNPEADGYIRRIALTAFGEGDQRHHVRRMAQWLSGRELIDQNGTTQCMLQPCPSDGVVRCYTGRSKIWRSVTPMVLPGFCNDKLTKALGLIHKCLRRAGFTAICKDLRRLPYHKINVKFRLPYQHKHKSLYYATFEFNEFVSGPVSLGDARCCGLGVFARDTPKDDCKTES